MPKASIILSSYNNLSALELSIESLRHQTEKDFEIIIADDGSTDGTIQYLEKQGVKYFSRPNEGYRLAYIWNRGAELAKGDRLIFGNSDIVWKSSHIKAHLFNSSSVIAGLYPSIPIEKVHLVNPENIKNDFSFIESLSTEDRRQKFILGRENPKIFNLKKIVPRQMHGGNWSMPSCVFKSLGGLDENFQGWGAEDFDIARRAQIDGHEILINFNSIGYHLDHEKNNRENTKHIGKSYFHKKWS